MRITGPLLFYWIQKRWPNAIYVRGDTHQPASVSRAMFWGSPQEMREHLVVLERARLRQIDRLYPGTIFLCLECDEPEVSLQRNECIALPGEGNIQLVFNRLGSLFDRFIEWENALDQAVHTFLSYDAIIRSCDWLLEDPMALLDTEFRYVSYSKRLAIESGYEDRYVDDGNLLTLEAVNMLTASSDFSQLESLHGVFRYVGNEEMLHINVFHAGQFVGRLALPCKKTEVENDYYSEILKIAAHYVGELYDRTGTFFRQSVAHAQLRDVLTQLLDNNPPSRAALRHQCETMGYEDGDEYCVVQIVAQGEQGGRRFNSVLASHIEGLWPQSTCFFSNEKCFMLLNKTRHEEGTGDIFVQQLAMFVRESLMYAGVSRPFADLFDLKYACRQTDIALEYGKRKNPMYWCYRFDSYACDYLVECGYKGFLPTHVCAPAVLDLGRYDAAHDTDLRLTLQTLVECQYNAVAAAKKLHVARSTLIKRMERVHEVTDLNLDQMNTRLYLALSFRIMEMCDSESAGPS